MVFSQSNINTHNLLKVVDLNNLKLEKETENTTGGDTDISQSLWTTPDQSEVYLKPEPLFEDAMFNEMDYEFFQDVMNWCPNPTKVETTAIDPPKNREDSSHNTDTIHTTFSPQSWDVLDTNSPTQAGFYTSTPNDPLSPNMDGFTTFDNKFLYNSDVEEKQTQLQSLDILNLPVVLGNIAPEEMVDLNPYPAMASVDYYNVNITQNTSNTHAPTLNSHKMFLHTDEGEESLDMKLGTALMGEVENNVVVFNEERREVEKKSQPRKPLSLNLTTTPALWPSLAISTPEVLSCVEQLEKEKLPIILTPTCLSPEMGFGSITGPPTDLIPVIPKGESPEDSDVDENKFHNSRRKRHNSEDSDETYEPFSEEKSTRKYKRRKPKIPIKDMILALEETQQLPKARRGRPPKRRASNVSSACSIDDNASCASTHGARYREQRDKNNEASKRSRMNRKLKELQMEQLAEDLEERNKKLKIKADILEDMTKRLKDALMTAIIQKQK